MLQNKSCHNIQGLISLLLSFLVKFLQIDTGAKCRCVQDNKNIYLIQKN